MNKFNGAVAIIAVLALLLGGYAAMHSGLVSNGSHPVGASGNLLAENYIPYILYNQGYNSAKGMAITGTTTLTGGTSLGSSGTMIGQLMHGICTLTVQAGTVVASSTSPFDCAVTGVVAGDTVLMQLSSSTAGVIGNKAAWFVVAAKASTTAGFVTALVYNNTGDAANLGATSTPLANYLVIHPN